MDYDVNGKTIRFPIYFYSVVCGAGCCLCSGGRCCGFLPGRGNDGTDMIDHVSIAVRDLKNAEAFYAALLAPLGLVKLREWPGAAIGFGKKYPEFWINKRAAMDRVASDSGVHICLRAPDTAAVDAFHATALKAGGTSDGAPGLRANITAAITPPSSAMPTATASRR